MPIRLLHSRPRRRTFPLPYPRVKAQLLSTLLQHRAPRLEAKAKVSRHISARDDAANSGMGPLKTAEEKADEDGWTVMIYQGRERQDRACF